ncbi:PfkB family carbohydrate kinase [Streptomyces sp. LP05-1]|uniref:PfkB family carbohydrate kinase n=1 Tax=Streptomyces pyxinae TaxID=2970734 RepID=A0ABT2CIZ0_9ACTN|nr:PfkB family carbohydrate kinase [Streptomyces sp. LP05-1]MCS0637368.1 PfkB family carbohydrate kinase [Streptomyces sp. LP05-1]
MSAGLLVIGDVVTDVVVRHTAPFAHATDTPARIRIVPGGAAANVACWAAHRGCREVRLLARVGADRAGWHEERLRASGVRPVLVRDPEAPTATVVALVDAAAERTFLTDSGASLRLTAEDVATQPWEGVGHLHLSGYLFFGEVSRPAALAAVSAAADRGVPVSVDPASAGFIERHGTDRFLADLAGVDLLLPNGDEAALLTGLADPGAAAVALSRRVPLVVLTLGAEGALIAADGRLIARVPAPAVRPVDSTGAGDAFTGGFLAARLAGAGPAEAAEAGCAAGAEAVAVVGGRPPR